ncbi:MAG: TonB-dependent receptor [Chitinophagaceae bacterium]|nr:TonB-dependent receptor [Chitinophagaceae bacterium]
MILMMILPMFTSAQSVNIRGRIINTKNEPVPGASIVIQETKKLVSANVEGEFNFTLEKGKRYSVLVSSTGYQSKSVDEIDPATLVDEPLVIVLEPKVTTGESIVIRSTRRQESTVALLTFQRTSSSMASGLAADFIRRTPDKNTGEVLKRVSGASIQDNRFVVVRGLSDRYNAAMLNTAQLPSSEPDRKAFSFDMFPAALIDNIIIHKTATPEFTGEFSGGLVQVNTRDIPTKDVLTVGVGIGYNNQSTFKPFTSNARNKFDWLGFDDGTRNLPDSFPANARDYRALGKNAAGVARQVALSQDFSGDVYRESTSDAMPIYNFNLTYAKTHRFKRGGILGTLVGMTYRKAQLIYEVDRRFHEADGTVIFDYKDRQNLYQVNWGGVANISYVKGRTKISWKNLFNQLYEDKYYVREGYNTSRLNDLKLYSSYLNQRSLATTQLEGEHQLSKGGIKLRWNGNAGYNMKTQPDLRTALYARTINTTQPFDIDPDDTRRFYSELQDYSVGGGGQLIVPMNWGLKDKQTLKLGGGNTTRFRDFSSRIFRYNVTNYNSFIAANGRKPVDQAFMPDNMGNSGFLLEEFTNNVDSYFGISVLNSAYGMMDNTFGDLRLIWGLRAENFQQLLTSRTQTGNRSVRLTEKWDMLPSLNAMLKMGDKTNLRLSGSRTVARPEFREIAEFAFYDYELNYGILGDTGLRRSSIMNYDARYEFYPKAGESISIGAFFKDFTDPIELRLDPASNADARRYFYSNALSARSIGFEVEVRKGLDFIAPKLKNFSVFGNYTYIRSEVTFNDLSAGNKEVKADRPLQGQSPYLLNLGLQYTSPVFNASLLYNRIGERLSLVGNNEFPNVFERPRNLVDLQMSTKVLDKKGELKLNVSDLLNNAFYHYENVNDATSFQDGTDRLFYAYRPGTTVTVSFSYDLSLGKK